MTSLDPERSSRDPNTLRVQYRENSWIRCHLAIQSLIILAILLSGSNAIRSAILATAWLLVELSCTISLTRSRLSHSHTPHRQTRTTHIGLQTTNIIIYNALLSG